jgi:hypothetical protein
MLSAYDAYKRHHELLFSSQTREQILENSAGVIENYLENRKIWAELNHYKETGRILGKHRIFSILSRTEQIRAMKVPELVLLREQCMRNLRRNRLNLKKDPSSPDTYKREERIKMLISELAEVNRILNL